MVDGDLPPGDVGRAYLLLRSLAYDEDGEPVEDSDEYAQVLLESKGDREDLLQGLGTLIDVFMSLFRPGGAMEVTADEPEDEDAPPQDALHVIVPAVVDKLTQTTWLPQDAVPTMAGALTAAALGGSCYRWRSAYGSWQPWELLPWTYTAVFLANLIDFGREQPGFALDMIEHVLLEGKPV